MIVVVAVVMMVMHGMIVMVYRSGYDGNTSSGGDISDDGVDNGGDDGIDNGTA